MKVKTALRNLNHILESEKEMKGRERRDALKQVLKKLKSKQKHLESKLADAPESDRPKIKKKLKTVKTHREKALSVLDSMKAN